MNNKRETFRLEGSDVGQVFVEIRSGATTLPVTPISLSLTGMFVEPQKGAMVSLSPGDVVEILLEFEGRRAEHRAIVRRREGKGYGLSFGELANTKDAVPEIRKIVMELQRRWLAKHKHCSDD